MNKTRALQIIEGLIDDQIERAASKREEDELLELGQYVEENLLDRPIVYLTH